jgi:hypothetical protein
MTPTLEQQMDELKREIEMRRRVYPAWVKSGRMTQFEADTQNATLRAALATLTFIASAGALVKSEFAGEGPPVAVMIKHGDQILRYRREE